MFRWKVYSINVMIWYDMHKLYSKPKQSQTTWLWSWQVYFAIHIWPSSLSRVLGSNRIRLSCQVTQQGKTRTPNQSRMVGTPVPDPWKPWPSIQRPAWKRVSFLVDGPIVSAAGYLSLSNYGSGLLLPACWWVMEWAGRGEHWTGQRRVICGPGALSSVHAHLSCWGRGEWAGGWGVRRAGRSWAENSLRLLPILRHFTLCFATILERRRGDVKYDSSLDGCSFFFSGQGCFCLCQSEERSDVLICWFHMEGMTECLCIFFRAVRQRRVKSIIPAHHVDPLCLCCREC